MRLWTRTTILLVALAGLVTWGVVLRGPRAEAATSQGDGAVQSTVLEFEGIMDLVAGLSRSMGPMAAAAPEGGPTPTAAAAPKQPGPSSLGALDQEWASFPRSKMDIGSYLASMPEDVSGRHLWRHVLLNPEDKYVPEQLRDGLEAVLVQLREPFRRFTAAQTVASRMDHDNALGIPTSALRQISSRDEDGSVRIRPDGVGVLTMRDGKCYAVPTPVFDKTLEYGHFVVVESAAGIVAWFQAAGLCDKSGGETVMAQAFDAAQYKNRMWKK
jgi:hypothetical protein